MIMQPETIPTTGDNIKERIIFPIPSKFNPSTPEEDIITAPITPPIRACELLEGIANFQVIIFHTIAPKSAAIRTCSSTCDADLTISDPIVFATPVLYIAPKKLRTAAMIIACCG